MSQVLFIGLLPFLFFSGGFSLPLGLPPLPEDPVISRVAPEECLGYVSWAGTATPNAKSTNQTEQLLAEPEVQALLAAIDGAVTAGINKDAQRGNQRVEAVKDIYPLVKTLLMRPAAVFVSKVEVNPQGPPNVQGGAIFNLAEKTTAVDVTLGRLEKLLPPGMVEKVEIGGVSFHSIKPSPTIHSIKPSPTMTVTWGVRGKYLIVGVGDGSVEGILKRAKAEPPAWLTAIRKQLPVDRPSNLIYFNVKQAVTQFAPLGGPQVKTVLSSFGLDNVSYLASVTGLDSKGTTTRTLVAIDGRPQGIFRLAAGKPLTAADLAPIPRDATFASAARFDANAAMELFLAQVEKFDPRARREIAQGIGQMEKELSINLQQDLLKPLGDVWCVYNSPAEGGLLITGLTGVVQVKDHDSLELTLVNLIGLFHDRVEGPAAEASKSSPNNYAYRRTPRIVKTPFAGQVIYHFDVPEGGFPMAPAWCLTEHELIVSTFPANIKSYLLRGKDFQSLATVPDVAQALEGGAVAVDYSDTRKVAEFVYPLLCYGGKVIASELNREGIPLDASLVPSAAAVFPHLQPSIGVVRQTSAGIEVESRGPMAGMGAGALLPLFGLWGYFSVESERTVPMKTATARAVPMSTNNLRQIALAVLSYASTHGTLPPAYISDKAGKPLLSWRVAILPYLGESALYKEFHLDEAWDSEHNKPLIARMPFAYRSPGAAVAVESYITTTDGKVTSVKPADGSPSGPPASGKTRYVTFRHAGSAFPGKDGIRLAEITRGTSNTLMAVEADEVHAVTWTKPDDLEFNPEKPLAGLSGEPMRMFNAVLCDGSLRTFSDSIDSEIFGDMVSRQGAKPAPKR
jgi:hypothetical protein